MRLDDFSQIQLDMQGRLLENLNALDRRYTTRTRGHGMSWLDLYNALLVCTLIALVVVRVRG